MPIAPKRFYTDPNGVPLFMLHGAIEDGLVFYSRNQKGLAPYFARLGYDVFVGDLRGKGESTPKIARGHHYGQTEGIREDIPAFIAEIVRIRGNVPQHWVGHSWGGVLLMSHLAHDPKYLPLVKSMIFFGTKRTIRARLAQQNEWKSARLQSRQHAHAS